MKRFSIKTLVIAVSFAFSAGAMAESMTKAEYAAEKDQISATYTFSKAGCKAMSGNANDICMAEAKGAEKSAKAELELRYKPSLKNRFDAQNARAEADYAVAKQKCDDKNGNVQDVCVKEAKAVETTAKAEAQAQLATDRALAKSDGAAAEARNEADQTIDQAQQQATTEELDAAYAVAKEKCDAFAGAPKDRCVMQAKTRYGRT